MAFYCKFVIYQKWTRTKQKETVEKIGKSKRKVGITAAQPLHDEIQYIFELNLMSEINWNNPKLKRISNLFYLSFLSFFARPPSYPG